MPAEVLCIDSGTSSLKGAVITSRGELISSGRVYCTSDCAVRTDALRKLILSLDGITSISAVVVSGNGPSLIPLKKNGTWGNPHLWNEDKTVQILDSMSMYVPRKIWIEKNLPEEYYGTEYFLTTDGFINYLLTDKSAGAVFSRQYLPFFWDNNEKKLPPLLFTGEEVGKITEKAARIFGLKGGIPVFAGGSDFLMAILGTGTLEPGMVCDRTGTSEGINYCSSSKIEFKDKRIMPHIVPGLWNISGLIPASGAVLSWLHEITGIDPKNMELYWIELYKNLCAGKKLKQLPIKKDGEKIIISKSDLIEFAKSNSIENIFSAAVLAVAQSVYEVIDSLEAAGLPVHEIRVSGGQCFNPYWNRIRELIIGKKILIPEIADGELVGCACAAFKGLGLFSSFKQAAEELVHLRYVQRSV